MRGVGPERGEATTERSYGTLSHSQWPEEQTHNQSSLYLSPAAM